jgi:pimeloyl-ACP methyl ester carboxylesterase
MSTDKPTIALVHGAFAESASWNGVIEQLTAQGHTALAIGNPLRSLAGDAAYVRDVLHSIEGPVVLVGHSYGGMVVSEAAAGMEDKVRALVYVCAFTPDTGESAFALSARFEGSTLADALAAYPVSTGGVELAIRPELFHQQFAADVPAARAALMAVTQRPATQTALTDTLTAAAPAWRSIPSWFVFGEDDRNIPPDLIRFFVERTGARGSTPVAGGSHALAVSQPEIVAQTILDACATTVPDPAVAA